MASATVLSQTLQAITITKIKELEKQRKSYEQLKSNTVTAADAEPNDIRKRVELLANGVEELNIWSESELHNIRLWLHQSKYDASVPQERLEQFERQLRARLDVRSQQLNLADLYSKLLIEWIDSPKSGDAEPPASDDTALDDFQMVESIEKEKLQQLRERFEQVVFEPHLTDEVKIDCYLRSLFEGNSGEEALNRLRREVKNKGETLFWTERLFDRRSLAWCIKSLLRSDLLDEEKKSSLHDFLQDEAVLNEIKDVLNMRYSDLLNWSWDLNGRGIPVVPRQSLNGKWRVVMDDDVLQALLTHWIGTQWAVSIKRTLHEVTRYTGIWKRGVHMPEEKKTIRNYYLDTEGSGVVKSTGVEGIRQDDYMNHFFLASLPSKLFEEAGGYDDDDDNNDNDDNESSKLSAREMKQLLLRTIATEVHVRRALDGEVAVVQSDFQWFATGLSHTTIFAILRFMGFQEAWIAFFKKVFEPPLQMQAGGPVRVRKCGLPMDHILEKLVGEIVLFFMDLAVNQETSMLLYRIHDDLWLCGSPGNCAKSWSTMEQYAKIMGLEFNKRKTGSAYLVDGSRKRQPELSKALPDGPVVMNFVVLDPESGEWVINKEHVLKHARQLQKQLAASKSILEWVKTWNSCIGRFFSYTFGEPANCFGRMHTSSVLETHKEIQNILFNDSIGTESSVSEYLVRTISQRFNAPGISTAFLYLPESLGGLGLHNPFTPLLLVYDNLTDDPHRMMREFIKQERKDYENAKKCFESLTERERRRCYCRYFPDEGDKHTKPSLSWDDAQVFFSFEEYTRWRALTSRLFRSKYEGLMAQPMKKNVWGATRVTRALEELADASPDNGLEGIRASNLSKEDLWTIQFYSEELFEKFGGLSIADNSLLPLGVLKAMRNRKVTWRMVL
ncbi:hypothetical protein AJ80_00557 [Polytolypa hystricis UAMH7299]|uniref:Reverse transcriptase domain-containing protein n=1 Tax=Polytolypa hystricis (strain UAMH7299) TaxID=1447883 RepID=A0A2B7Z3E8_POLH7|nr:hypothetical protein AJ80_00557 [Polytolypa hystricis UAMH7299]